MNNSQISAGSGDVGVTIVRHGAQVHLYQITEAQLDSLAKGMDHIFLAFASALLGAFVTLLVELSTMDTAQSPVRTGVVIGATITTGVLMAFFCLLAIRDWLRSKDELKRIKKGEL